MATKKAQKKAPAKKTAAKKTPTQKATASTPVAPDDKTKVVQPSSQDQKDDLMYRLLDQEIQIPIGMLRNKHIFIATPCYGGQIGEPYFRSMLKFAMLCNKYNIKYTVSTLANESLIPRGRNTLTSFFMENSEATHLFFIDADIEFNAEDLLRQVAYDKDIVVGAYPKKALNWNSIMAAAQNPDLDETPESIEGHSTNYAVNFDFLKDENGKPVPQIQIQDNLVKLKDASTGFMCIKKECIQKMFDNYPELKYNNDINVDQKFEKHMYALFDCIIDPESRRYLSEDYTFCRYWQMMGGEVFLDPRTSLNHVGHYTFRGNIRKLFTGENNYKRKQQI
jgi:hypothetical protein